MATRKWISVPHRILRSTSKYVFVEQRPSLSEEMTGSWLDGEPPAYRLERQMLEQQGYAFIPATADLSDLEEPVFFVSACYTVPGTRCLHVSRCCISPCPVQ